MQGFNMNGIKRAFGLAIVTTLLIFGVTGCGYKPASYYAKQEINGKVYVNLVVNLDDPKNSVLIKDAMNELLVNKLDSKLVYKESEADTIMNVKLNSVGLSEQSYGDDGYVKLYKAIVNISVDYQQQGKPRRSLSVSGRYDFSIDDGTSTISEAKRFEAIRSASNKALDEVISKLAVQNFKSNVKRTTSK